MEAGLVAVAAGAASRANTNHIPILEVFLIHLRLGVQSAALTLL
jgi:hypothetical protein